MLEASRPNRRVTRFFITLAGWVYAVIWFCALLVLFAVSIIAIVLVKAGFFFIDLGYITRDWLEWIGNKLARWNER